MSKEEVKILMDEKRNFYIKDSKGTEYNFWPQGYGVPVYFMARTEAEQVEDDERRKAQEKEWMKAEKRRAEDYEKTRPWYKKIFD